MKIVHRTRDCVEIIAGVQHIDPCRSNLGGGLDPCDPWGIDTYANSYRGGCVSCYLDI